MSHIAFLFPGQGAQFVGMARDLCEQYPTARRLFDLADQTLGVELSKICFEGPEDRLSATDVCQPAIFTHSAAVLALMGESTTGKALAPTVAAGLSLGEYTALYAAGAMDFATGLKLVARRGQYMQEAAVVSPSGMVAVIGVEDAKVAELAAEAAAGQVLVPANYLSPGNVVISGHKDACERAVALAEKFGSRAIPLKVAGAFHTELMAPAAARLAEAIAGSEIRMPNWPVLANYTAKPYGSVEEIRSGLLKQLTSPVLWAQSLARIYGEPPVKAYEIGPGRVIAGLIKKIDRRAEVVNLGTADNVKAMG